MPPPSGGLTLDSCYRYRVLIYESDRADLGDESQVLHLGSPNLLIIGYRTATAFRKASVTACAMPGAARFPVRRGTGYSSDGRPGPERGHDVEDRLAGCLGVDAADDRGVGRRWQDAVTAVR